MMSWRLQVFLTFFRTPVKAEVEDNDEENYYIHLNSMRTGACTLTAQNPVRPAHLPLPLISLLWA